MNEILITSFSLKILNEKISHFNSVQELYDAKEN